MVYTRANQNANHGILSMAVVWNASVTMYHRGWCFARMPDNACLWVRVRVSVRV